jgi:hypothetical protein
MVLVRGGKVYDGTSGNVLIGRISSISPVFSMKTDETAEADSTSSKPEPINIFGKISLTGKLDFDDPGQAALWTKFVDRTHINPLKIVYSGLVGDADWIGYFFEGVITGWKPAGTFGKYTDIDITIDMYGLPAIHVPEVVPINGFDFSESTNSHLLAVI